MNVFIYSNQHTKRVVDNIGLSGIRVESKANNFGKKIRYVVNLCIAILISRTVGAVDLYIPHSFGRYGVLINLIRYKNLHLLDDGITFEYWSDFHENFIRPLLLSEKIKTLIGSGLFTGWPKVNIKHIKMERCELWRWVLIKDFKLNCPYKKAVVYIDNGDAALANRVDRICELESISKTDIIILTHPSRGCQNISAEARVEIMLGEFKFLAVYGFGSTVLFNLKDLSKISGRMSITSFSTGNHFLDYSLNVYGVRIIKDLV